MVFQDRFRDWVATRVADTLTNADPVEFMATLAAEQLPAVVGSHARPKAVFTGPLHLADSVRVVHFLVLSVVGLVANTY
jgi:hypothetical protein